MMEGFLFGLLAVLTLSGAVGAALLRNLVHCALSLTLTFVGLALLYLNLDAQFVGLSQVLVYIGAVAILVVFAILLTGGAGKMPTHPTVSAGWRTGWLAAVAVGFVLIGALLHSPLPHSDVPAPEVTVQQIGRLLMGPYVLPLEIVAVLLTVALIGAVIVAMPERKGESK
jgi:NADH-quinone oxidoreductase subunit J